MGEAFIWYRGRNTIDPELLKQTVITTNSNYNAPVTGIYQVYCVGGGGGGGGGCRNAQNVSQVFYGAAGTRGTLATGNVTLNQGDLVACTLGAGGTAGTNNTTRTGYTNGTYNSRGTSGTSGGATSFGSHLSGAGGTYGAYSWSRTYWSNVNGGWVNQNLGWNNTYSWNNSLKWVNKIYNYHGQNVRYGLQKVVYIVNNTFGYVYNSYSNAYINSTVVWRTTTHNSVTANANLLVDEQSWQGVLSDTWNAGTKTKCYITINSRWSGSTIWKNTSYWAGNSNTSVTGPYKCLQTFQTVSDYNATYSTTFYDGLYEGIAWTCTNMYGYVNVMVWNNKIQWSNYINWNNRILTTATRLYTSIQAGSWWYLNNNAVTTSGTRIYKGDGGNSGVAGNSGYILVIPPQS